MMKCNSCGEEKDSEGYPLVTRFSKVTGHYKRRLKRCKHCVNLEKRIRRVCNAEFWRSKNRSDKMLKEFSDGSVNKESVLNLISRYKKCPYCLNKLEREHISIDHMEPLAYGGLNIFSNIIPCCHDCNMDKNSKSFNEWFEQLSTEAQDLLMTDDHVQVGLAGV